MIFLAAWTTEWIGVHAIFGAFLIGIIIPRMGGITVEMTHKLEDLVGIALLPLYFASSGLKTRLALLNDWTTAMFCVLVILVACSGKIIGCSVAAKVSGFPWRESLSIGILMNTKGLVELIVLNIGVDAGVINERIFAVMIVMALVTTFMTSPIIAYVYPPKYQIEPKVHKKRIISTNEDMADQHILLYLKDNDSIPLAANILQMFRVSLPPGGRLFLNGLKAFTDFDRSSAIMVTTQRDRIIENDSTLKMFQFFGKLIGAVTKSFVATTRMNDIGVEIDRIAQNEHCDLMLLPWQKNDETGDQRKAVTSILESAHHTTLAVFVDNRPSGTDAIVHGSPFEGITLIFANGGSLNDREAFKVAAQLRSHVKNAIPFKIIHLRSGTAKHESDLIKAAKSLYKENNENTAFQKVKLHSETDSIETVLEKLLISPSLSNQLIIMGHTNMVIKTEEKDMNGVENAGNLRERGNGSFVRRLTIRSRKETEEEQTFGTFGEHIFNLKNSPSMLIVHAFRKPTIAA
uniref:Cation/H+ exchanger domain-containing protein n=1 Tax=Panagrolaimus davidi TaxID=227884 RepID=A0A914QBA1_9BILA